MVAVDCVGLRLTAEGEKSPRREMGMKRTLVFLVSVMMVAALGMAGGTAGEASAVLDVRDSQVPGKQGLGAPGVRPSERPDERLPVAAVFPADGSVLTRPDTEVRVQLNSGSPLWSRFRQQFEKGAFELRLASSDGPVAGLTFYDVVTSLISFRPSLPLRRYSAYTATLSVKADLRAAANQSGNASVSFGFRTGSDLHEPIRFDLAEALGEPTVLERARLELRMTDDYGLPARGAKVAARVTSEDGLRLSGSASLLVSSEESSDRRDAPGMPGVGSGPLQSGQASIEVSNREKELVTVEVSVSGPYGPVYKADRRVTFRAGPPAQASFDERPDAVVVDRNYLLTARIEDSYGNSVEDGAQVSLRINSLGAETATTSKGVAQFNLRAPRKTGRIEAVLEYAGDRLMAPVALTVLPGEPSKISVQTVSASPQIGQPIFISGIVSDSFENPVPGVEVEVQVTGSVTGLGTLDATTDHSGIFSAAFVPTKAEHLALLATVSGYSVQAYWPEAVTVWETITGGRALTLRAIGSDQAPSSAVTAIAPNRLNGQEGSFTPGKWVKVRRSDGTLMGQGQVAGDGSVTMTTQSFAAGDILKLEEVASAPQPIKQLVATAEGRFWPGTSVTKYMVRFLSIPKSSIPPGATLRLEANIWPYAGAGYARMWMEVRDGGTHYYIDLWAEGQINRDYFNWQAAVYAEVK